MKNTNKKFDSVDQYLRVANYLTAAQIFLQDNFMMQRDLTFEDIKTRLLGHWEVVRVLTLLMRT